MPDALVTAATLLLIFALRIVDVSAGVLRVMLLVAVEDVATIDPLHRRFQRQRP